MKTKLTSDVEILFCAFRAPKVRHQHMLNSVDVEITSWGCFGERAGEVGTQHLSSADVCMGEAQKDIRSVSLSVD